MIFGEKETFAIEVTPEHDRDGRMYGSLRFWVAGSSVGDVAERSNLLASARWGRVFLAASGRRTRPELDSLGATEIYEYLFGRYVQEVNAAPQHIPIEPWDRDAYVLDDVGQESLLDTFTIVVVRRIDGADRIVVRNHDTNYTLDSVVPNGVCDRVLADYCASMMEAHGRMVPELDGIPGA